MVKKNIKVIWDETARTQLKDAIEYIKQDSLQNAQNVKKDIIAASRSLSTYPEKHPLDKYKMSNDGTYRAFEKYHLRISYRVLAEDVRILRLRNTKQKPIMY